MLRAIDIRHRLRVDLRLRIMSLLPRYLHTYLKPTLALLLLTSGLVTGVALVQRTTSPASIVAAGANSSLTLPPSLSASVNQQFSVPISLNTDNSPIIGTDVHLSFDHSLLRLLAVTPVAVTGLPTFLPITAGNVFDADRVISTANQTGVIEFSAITFNPSSQTVSPPFQNSSSEILANLIFQALQPGTTAVSFVFQPALTTDSNLVSTTDPPTDLLSSVTNLSLTISSPITPTGIPTPIPPSPPPTPTPVPLTPTPIPSCTIATNPPSVDLLTGEVSLATASVTISGTASINRVDFGSYNAASAAVSPASDTTSLYQTVVTAVAPGNTAIWARAYLNSGSDCVTPGSNDTDVNVTAPPPPPAPSPDSNLVIATLTPSPFPTPTSVPCSLASASWNSSGPVTEGASVELSVVGTNCSGQSVSFEVREADSLLEGLVDEPARTQPVPAVFVGDTAASTWIAESQNDCGGLCNPPEYFFNATLTGTSNSIRSSGSQLNVNPATPNPTPTPPPNPLALLPTATPDPLETITPPPAPSETPSPQPNNGGGGGSSSGGGGGTSGGGGGGSSSGGGGGSSSGGGGGGSTGKGRGDLNSDGKTNVFDLSLILSRYGGSNSTADLNGDGRVNILDLSILLSNWGK